MSYLNTLSYEPGQGPPDASSYPGYYACGPSGDTYYVWPAFNNTDASSSASVSSPDQRTEQIGPVRCVKRRVTNNKKERRRTMSINKAFCDLRCAIPQIPADTKLSKIKTLRLATSYILHLMDILAEIKTPESFDTNIIKGPEVAGRKREAPQQAESSKAKRSSGRTGWPQHVWSLELKHENPS